MPSAKKTTFFYCRVREKKKSYKRLLTLANGAELARHSALKIKNKSQRVCVREMRSEKHAAAAAMSTCGFGIYGARPCRRKFFAFKLNASLLFVQMQRSPTSKPTAVWSKQQTPLPTTTIAQLFNLLFPLFGWASALHNSYLHSFLPLTQLCA